MSCAAVGNEYGVRHNVRAEPLCCAASGPFAVPCSLRRAASHGLLLGPTAGGRLVVSSVGLPRRKRREPCSAALCGQARLLLGEHVRGRWGALGGAGQLCLPLCKKLPAHFPKGRHHLTSPPMCERSSWRP